MERCLPIVAALIYTVLFLTTIIAVLKAARTSESSSLRMASQLAGTLLRNPVVISPLLGVLYSMTALPLPKAVSNYLDLMAAAVGPAALFAVGLSLVGRKLTSNAGEVIWLSVLKTVVNPILTFVLVTYVFVMDSFWSQAAVVVDARDLTNIGSVLQNHYCALDDDSFAALQHTARRFWLDRLSLPGYFNRFEEVLRP